MNRAILHVDMDAFYASIEQRDNPEWRGKPVIVGAGAHERGVVSAASYEARRFGVHSAMPSRTAGRLCPEGIFVPVNMEKYRQVSHQIMAIFETFTPLVQPLSVDEAFLDISGTIKMFEEGAGVGRRIKAEINRQTNLTASVGVAPNKFLAKLASDLDKPDGLTVITAEAREYILAPLPVSKIWGVGKVTEQRLLERGIRTIGDLQQYPVDQLRRHFGNSAEHLRALAFGDDDREVETDQDAKSISSEHTFDIDTDDLAQIKRCLLAQAEEVASKLRRDQLAARTVQLKLRYADFFTITRRKTLPTPTQDDMMLYQVAEQLMRAEAIDGKRIRLIGVGGSNLVRPEFQTELFDQTHEKRARLAKAVDDLRAKLGPDAIKRGTSIDDPA